MGLVKRVMRHRRLIPQRIYIQTSSVSTTQRQWLAGSGYAAVTNGSGNGSGSGLLWQ
jgi:hypothetical protein